MLELGLGAQVGWPDPINWINKGSSFWEFQNYPKTVTIKIKIKNEFFLILSLYVRTLPEKLEIKNTCFFFSLKMTMKKYVFLLFQKTKKEYNFSFWRNKSPFSLEIFVFLLENKGQGFYVVKKRMVFVFLVPFMTWSKKIGQWNNQFGSWTFQKVIGKSYFSSNHYKKSLHLSSIIFTYITSFVA